MSSKIEPKAFVKPDGSLWLGVEDPQVRLEKVIENKLPLSREKRTSIWILTTNIRYRYSSTTYPSHPIQLLEGEMKKLLEILHMNETELKSRMVLATA